MQNQQLNIVSPLISKLNTAWVETLAMEELSMDQSGIVHLDNHLDPAHFLEESSLQLMDQMRDLFEVYVHSFNQFRAQRNISKNQDQQSTSLIKIFKISNTVNDFLLYRNSLKFIVARKSIDIIGLNFLSNAGGSFGARMSDYNHEHKAKLGGDEIKAHLGPFNEVSWYYANQVVKIDSLVKHYLTEFVRHSAR